ncbi:hypothetical protein [Neobacillus cucumis]|uniref:hypothetical protein n=1 Tax=Neobacillus cucumis TaxID=1740721 RepID=UPI0015E079C1|nr:hypothetical protein [Neobacillus cucumis]
MKELVGVCSECGKEVYCLDGFLNGVHTPNKELYCFDCFETHVLQKKAPQS